MDDSEKLVVEDGDERGIRLITKVASETYEINHMQVFIKMAASLLENSEHRDVMNDDVAVRQALRQALERCLNCL